MTSKASSAQATAAVTPVASGVLQRQCACGNHTASAGECSTCASKKLQRKLSIGSTNDPMELEADRIADQVMAYRPAHLFSNISAPKIQRRAESSTEAVSDTGTAPGSVERVLARSGSPLPTSARKDMEQRFGYDFSQVRIHTDKEAQRSAADVNANAYTQKNNIVFGSGYFAPDTTQGKKLLAHELTHVVQQSAADKLALGDGRASGPGITQAAPLQISRSSTPQLQRMTSKEAQKKLWGLVPDIVKPYAKPIALQARDAIETVIPPTTELPKAVEAVVEKAASVAPIINPPTPTSAARTETKPTDKKPAAPAPKKPSADSWISGATKEKLRDKAMENLGTVKGVMLEATNIVDSLIWVSHAGNELAEGGIDKVSSYMGASEESRQDALKVYRTVFSQYAAIQEQAKKNGWIDEVTGAVAVSGKFSKAYDGAAEELEQKAFGDLPKEKATIFTNYELGELKGAVGSQVALAYVGVEEVQLVLKGLGVIGAVKSIVTSVQQNPTGWKTDPNFWVAILNAALTVVGLRQTKAAARLSRFLIAAGSLGNAIPIILNLAKHYSDPQLDADPEKKRKLLAQDYSALIRVVADAITAAIQHASAQKKAGGNPALSLDEPTAQTAKSAPMMEPTPDAAPAAHPVEPVKNTAPLKAVAPEKNTPVLAPVEPVAGASAKVNELPTDAPAKTKPVAPTAAEIEPHKIADATREGSPSKDSQASAGKALPPADNDAAVTSIIKEQAIAEKPVQLANGEQHEAVVTNKGIGLCSPGPCPVIHVEYRKELKDFPSLNKWHEKIKVMRKEGKHEQAATEAAQLIRTLDAVRNNALKSAGPANNAGKGMTVETSEAKTPQEKQASKDFKKVTQQELNDLVDKAFADPGKSGAKIDAEGVTDKTINSKSDRTRHLDVEGPKDAQGKPVNPGQVLTVAEAQQAKKVLGKTITASETGAAVKDAWNLARAEVEKKYGPLTKENYGDLYNKTRDKFWDNVQGSEAAKKFFTDGGFSFDEGRAPMLAASSDKNLRRSQSRVSLDHLEPKATGENWQYALDGDNLMFVMQADNTKLQHIESTKLSLQR